MAGPDVLLGRAAEQSRLEHMLEAARASRGGLCLLAGEAGIGKSRPGRYSLERAQSLGFSLVISGSNEDPVGELSLPFRNLEPCLASLGLGQGSKARPESPWELGQVILSRLATRSREAPIFWLIEDLQRFEAESLDLLHFLAQPIAAIGVLVVATVRTDEPKALTLAYDARQSKLERLGTSLRLSPLPDEAVLSLDARHLGRPPSPEERSRLLDFSAGNPFFLEQAAWQWKSKTRVPSVALKELWRSRTLALPKASADILETASVFGGEFQARTLASVSELLPAQLIDALEPALRGDLLTELGPGHFRFRHALFAEALHQEQTAQRLRELHQRAASAYKKLGNSAQFRMSRARHLLHAATLGAPLDEVEFVRETIRSLDAESTPGHAHSLHQLLRHAEKLGSTPPSTVAELIASAFIARRAGAQESARAICLEAIELAQQNGNGEALAQAVLALGADTVAARVDTVLLEGLRLSLARRSELSESLTLRLEARLAAALQPATDPEEPCAIARRVLSQTNVLDDFDLSDVLYFCGAALTDFAPLHELGILTEQLLEVCARLGQPDRALRASVRSGLIRAQLGDFSGLENSIEASRVYVESSVPSERFRHFLLDSLVLFGKGAILESERLTVSAERLSDLTDDPWLLLSIRAHRSHHQATLGTIDELDLALRETRNSVSRLGLPSLSASAINATLLARLGEKTRLAQELSAIPDAALPKVMAAFPLVMEACALGGSDAQVELAEQAAQKYPYPHLVSGHVPITYEGPITRIRGLLSARKQEFARASKEFGEARAQCQNVGFRLWEARICVEHAGVLWRSGDKQSASLLAAEASALCHELECPDLLAKLPHLDASPRTLAPIDRELESASLSRQGDLWLLRCGEQEVMLAHSRGVEILSRLLARPREEIHVLSLSSDTEHELLDSDAGQLVDPRALREYRLRLAVLSEAQGDGPSQNQDEAEWLRRELARADGKGAVRRAGSLAERARINVQRRLKEAVAKVEQANPELGRYLRRAVRTGTYCTFRP